MMITSRARLARVGCSALLIASYLLWGCGTAPTDIAPSHENDVPPVDLARHYSPIIHQGTASDHDFITAVDFDGDWTGSNNWENQPTGDLSAYVYYSVAETETHWFLFYALFHPRDYTSRRCDQSGGCHENDMESIQIVVAKDDTPYGRLQAMETLAHGDIFLYTADPYTPDRPVRGGYLKVKGKIRLQGSHPIVTVETYGHGIHGGRQVLLPHVVIYHEGSQAEVPESLDPGAGAWPTSRPCCVTSIFRNQSHRCTSFQVQRTYSQMRCTLLCRHAVTNPPQGRNVV